MVALSACSKSSNLSSPRLSPIWWPLHRYPWIHTRKISKKPPGAKTTNGQDAKYPTKAFTDLNKNVGGLTNKWSGVVDEVNAFNEDLAFLDKKCIR